MRAPPAWAARSSATCPKEFEMSRIGRMPIAVPNGVEIKLGQGEVSVKGPQGSLVQRLNPLVTVAQENGSLQVSPVDESREANAMSGDRKSTRLNSSHVKISYAVFCLKK